MVATKGTDAELKQLQDVLATFAKKLVLLLNITDLEAEFIHKLNRVFQENKGEHQVSFDVMELERIKRMVEQEPAEIEADEEFVIDSDDEDATDIPPAKNELTEIEEIKVITKLSMPSQRLKVNITNELLIELEKMQINFKLN